MIKHGFRPKCGNRIEYTSWQSMKARCLNPNHVAFDRYGGRGITIDPRWIESFEAFLADVGQCHDGCVSLDRKETDKGYFKDNVKWATAKQQAQNRTNNVVVTVNGITECLAEACRRYGIRYTTAKRRLDLGMSHTDALLTPPSARHSHPSN